MTPDDRDQLREATAAAVGCHADATYSPNPRGRGHEKVAAWHGLLTPKCVRWLLDAAAERDALQAAIRRHRDERGDDRCWQDDETLYGVLPEGFTPPAREVAVELVRCAKYIACRRNPKTEYVSPQREIDALRTLLAECLPWLPADDLSGRVRAALGRNSQG